MASTLEKLLSIQGVEEPAYTETLSEAQKGAKQGTEAAGGFSPPLMPTGATEGKSEATRGNPPPQVEPSPPPLDMLEVWREAYRIYTKYAPAIRAAAKEPEGWNPAGEIFLEALPRVIKIAQAGEDAEIIALRVYDMLDDVWQRARKDAS